MGFTSDDSKPTTVLRCERMKKFGGLAVAGRALGLAASTLRAYELGFNQPSTAIRRRVEAVFQRPWSELVQITDAVPVETK